MERKILEPGQLSEALKTLDGWTADGKMLKKSVKFANFAQALDHVNRIGALAEAADHHPDITFGWGYADIALTTHDRGGITDVDISLAKKIDQLGTQAPSPATPVPPA
ncbi:MAG: 4a-hydroxytetrahydrobiopterin dehydratase [Pyrinomonadaceae bacterium]